MTTTPYETLRLRIDDGIATITLARPESLNAFTQQSLVELRSALKAVIASPARCLVLTGEGRAFSSGADLAAPRDGLDENDPDEFLRDYFVPPFRMLAGMEIPTIAAVNGPCAGSGMSLALSCDIVIASESAFFLQPFVSIGLVPDLGSSWLLPQALGRARATGLMLLGEKLPAADAAAWGMIWKTVPPDQLEHAVLETARKLKDGPSRGPAMIKQLIARGLRNGLAEQMQAELEFQRVALRSADHIEARAAFKEKRAPVFVR
ncbi:enoyl-CoA hydratase-related protein [Variovorax sp. J22R115]|uniref:enoyl-CoA hydratase-related protein n=1 Tax=Variovorax sp. J22R115 TaxID=3053509 RepID=UPI0025788B64|nr:enoyl-CoA hydratase-related protein [Variovorax sp. J22R115]MDM0049974.1 enoyl-CoA hydratase-related protein [Variovorax sp. J22R115]